ncbi:MAG: hypothetical protein WC476_12100 [Phycisphaerae bacterium]
MGIDEALHSRIKKLAEEFNTSNEPMDGDEVDQATELFRIELNHAQGNTTLGERFHALAELERGL